MPGHIYSANCPCGYSKGLYPGFSRFNGEVIGKEMAYIQDGNGLDTLMSKEVQAKGLRRLSNPELTGAVVLSGEDGIETTYGYFDCPKCKYQTMTLCKLGNWS